MNTVETEVLFQKLGSTWYVFSEVNGEAVYSSLPMGMDPRETSLELHAAIEEHMRKISSKHSGPEQIL